MAEPELYRVAKGQWLTGPEFATALFAAVAAHKPAHPLAPYSRWYCHKEDCPVRDVTVAARYVDEPPGSWPASPRPPGAFGRRRAA